MQSLRIICHPIFIAVWAHFVAFLKLMWLAQGDSIIMGQNKVTCFSEIFCLAQKGKIFTITLLFRPLCIYFGCSFKAQISISLWFGFTSPVVPDVCDVFSDSNEWSGTNCQVYLSGYILPNSGSSAADGKISSLACISLLVFVVFCCPTISVTLGLRQSDIHTLFTQWLASCVEMAWVWTHLCSSLFFILDTTMSVTLHMNWVQHCICLPVETVWKYPHILTGSSLHLPLWLFETTLNTFDFQRGQTTPRTNHFFSRVT